MANIIPKSLEQVQCEGFSYVSACAYCIESELSQDALEEMCTQALIDPVTESLSFGTLLPIPFDWIIEVKFKKGVTDTPAEGARTALADVCKANFETVFSIKKYAVQGNLMEADVREIAKGHFGNALIHDIFIFPATHSTCVESIHLPNDDLGLMEISKTRLLALNLQEMRAIYNQYHRAETKNRRQSAGLNLEPTDVEIEAIAQTWSEHCKHKIFNAEIAFEKEDGSLEIIDSVFRTYIKRTTQQLEKSCPWLKSVFTDNAGIVQFTSSHCLAFKVETHNSPSALDPYGGALTGILGVMRDSMGSGKGARLVANTNVLCFALPCYSGTIPNRLMHPRRVLKGVRKGIEDGGNKMGVPTVNGSLVFHESFLAKPVVYCGSVGILPQEIGGDHCWVKKICPGDAIVILGGKTGRDGIHGATFSSMELNEESPSSAVQIGDPFTQKKMHDLLTLARDENLFRCITDNGAGGLSSSVGELAELSGGAEIHLCRVPLKCRDITPWEILLSESQERMTLAVPQASISRLLSLAQEHEVLAENVGRFTDSGEFRIFYENQLVGLLDLEFLHHGVPKLHLKARLKPYAPQCIQKKRDIDFEGTTLKLLSSYNVCSKESVVRQYDHEVQASTVLKPLVGKRSDGPSNACIVSPREAPNFEGFVLSHGICPKYSKFDCYHMAAMAVDEAIRNAVCVGARRIALLDNFSWPDPIYDPSKNPDGKHKLAQLVMANRALFDYCTYFEAPLISGKDSMKNDYKTEEIQLSIEPTLLISALGIVSDFRRACTMDFKAPGDLVFLLGETRDELAGSEYYSLIGETNRGKVPTVSKSYVKPLYMAITSCIEAGIISSCHDLSDGGLSVALAESAIGGNIGADITLPKNGDVETLLFSESGGRLLVSVSPSNKTALLAFLSKLPITYLGKVASSNRLAISHDNRVLVDCPIDKLRKAWKSKEFS